MLIVLLSLQFSSSFVPLCVQYDYQKTAFHLFMKTVIHVFLVWAKKKNKNKKTSNLAVMVLKSVKPAAERPWCHFTRRPGLD